MVLLALATVISTLAAIIYRSLASKIDGYVPLGVPTGYSVSFADDGSAEIVYTPPIMEDVIEEPIQQPGDGIAELP